MVLKAPVVLLSKPELESVRTDNKVLVRVRSTRNADYLALILPISEGISDITMNGLEAVLFDQGEYQVLTFFAPNSESGESVEFGFLRIEDAHPSISTKNNNPERHHYLLYCFSNF